MGRTFKTQDCPTETGTSGNPKKAQPRWNKNYEMEKQKNMSLAQSIMIMQALAPKIVEV